MPIAPRRPDNYPREEWFSDKSGPLILEIAFENPHGFEMREISSFEQRVTRGQPTAIVIDGLSRARIGEIRGKIDAAIAAAREKQAPAIKEAVTALTETLNHEVAQWAGNLEKLDIKARIDEISAAIQQVIDTNRKKAFDRDRGLILDVLFEIEGLKQVA